MDKVAKLVVFSGSVQGVGFRFTARSIAGRYDLAGYVKNTSNGKVEVLAQGADVDIDECIADLRDTFAIRDVKAQNVPVDDTLQTFDIAF
ncbi:MAG: acylphosphatase [Anaerohalosphaeraceae bacterium]|nr:acylphosphatase [Anaerohalosphaeraceae bacterium]